MIVALTLLGIAYVGVGCFFLGYTMGRDAFGRVGRAGLAMFVTGLALIWVMAWKAGGQG